MASVKTVDSCMQACNAFAGTRPPIFVFNCLYDQVEEMFGLRIGDHVLWSGADKDVPAGTAGLVLGFVEHLPDYIRLSSMLCVSRKGLHRVL